MQEEMEVACPLSPRSFDYCPRGWYTVWPTLLLLTFSGSSSFLYSLGSTAGPPPTPLTEEPPPDGAAAAAALAEARKPPLAWTRRMAWWRKIKSMRKIKPTRDLHDGNCFDSTRSQCAWHKLVVSKFKVDAQHAQHGSTCHAPCTAHGETAPPCRPCGVRDARAKHAAWP